MTARALAPGIVVLFLATVGRAEPAGGRPPPGPSLPPPPAPIGGPRPGPVTDGPYAPQPILQGGVVMPLYPPGSPHLRADRVREAEVYTLNKIVHGRINSIVNIHNPSIEIHLVDTAINTGSVVILAAGGAHRYLNVGTESADLVPFFYNFGVNTAILRNRLRNDGYDVGKDAVHDALQAIRLLRAHARQWDLDPRRIGIMGFSAGAELAAPAGLFFEDFDRSNQAPDDPVARLSSRPDFVALVYPGPSPFAKGGNPAFPRNVPPSFVVSPGSGDRVHALWAMEYATAMLQAGVPNLELHIYGNGRHPGDPLGDGSRMSGGLTDRNGIPFGSWQHRFIDWIRDLGFLQRPGTETRAARDVASFVAQSAPRGVPPAVPTNH